MPYNFADRGLRRDFGGRNITFSLDDTHRTQKPFVKKFYKFPSAGTA